MNIERLVLCVALLIAALVGKRVFKTYVSPMTIMAMPWAAVLMGQQLLASDFPFGINAAVVIATAASMFCGASLITALIHRRAAHSFNVPHISITLRAQKLRLWDLLCWLMVAVAIAHLCVDLYLGYYLEVGLRGDGSVDPYAFYNEVVDRVSVATGIAFRASVALTYVGSFVLAVELARTWRLRVRSALFWTAIIVASWFTTAKTTALLNLSIAAMAVGVLGARSSMRISARRVAALALLGVFLSGYMWLANTRRYGGEQVGAVFANNLAVQYVGASAALSEYLDHNDGWKYGNFRGLAIMGPLEWFGAAERERGVYDENIYLTADAIATNQYTGLRLLLEDIGFGGMIITMGFLGAIATSLFFSFCRRPSVVKCVLLCNIYLLLLWLPITLLTYYTFWTVQLLLCPLIVGHLVELRVRPEISNSSALDQPVGNARAFPSVAFPAPHS